MSCAGPSQSRPRNSARSKFSPRNSARGGRASIGPAPMVDFILEGKAGGRWYELDQDGTQCDTGHILVFEPPHRVVLAWQLNDRWQYDPDPSHASEVEIRFVAEGPSHTRVELEHRGFERHGAAADAVRDSMDSPDGWTAVLEIFARHLTA